MNVNESQTSQQYLSKPGMYTAKIGTTQVNADINLGPGGVYTLVIGGSVGSIEGDLLETSPPNSVHILWLLPQYIIITAAEIMFSITGLEFSFTQAPLSMKSLISAAWLLTVSFGNLIVVIVAEAKFFESQAKEFFLFAGLMIIDMIIFILIAVRYKTHVPKNTDSHLTDKDIKLNGN
uniref:Uncharacterized protein n=3 Tax=Clastoptera arizonana TaxID=38151 RepID=A0A1B6DEB5_9HEMI